LIPFGEPAAVPAGENTGLWVNIQAPLEARAGEYKGELRLSAEQGEARIPLVAKVWDFRLPCPPALQTSAGAVSFAVDKTMKALKYEYEKGKPYGEYCRWCLDYGFAPGHGRGAKLEEYVEWRNCNRGVSALCVGWDSAAPWATLENLEKHGWKGRMWVYAPFDEHGDGQVPKVAEWCKGFKEKWPHVKILDVYYGADLQPLEGLVDIWCRGKERNDWTRERPSDLGAGGRDLPRPAGVLGDLEPRVYGTTPVEHRLLARGSAGLPGVGRQRPLDGALSRAGRGHDVHPLGEHARRAGGLRLPVAPEGMRAQEGG
jgi:hypothetical protein